MSAHRSQLNIQECGRSQKLGNNNCERRTQDDCKIRQSQISEMTPVQVSSHHAQRNIRECGRSQQLVSDNSEIHDQDETVQFASLNSTEIFLV